MDQEFSLKGKKIGHWIINEKLGSGGMAEVYLGHHEFLKKVGAIKILHPEVCQIEHAVERFKREALACSQINHPNVIKIEDFGQDNNGDFYMVMELLKGRDLDSFQKEFPFAKSWNRHVLLQVFAGLEVAHNEGIVHRDLKPSNIFLLPNDGFPKVKVLDFGIAKMQHFEEGNGKLTKAGSILGTPAYLSPEQLSGGAAEITPAADVYAMGVMIFQMFTGRLPIERDSFIEHVLAVMNETPPKIGVLRKEFAGSLLEDLLAQMLLKVPKKRPQSMSELCSLFEKAFAELKDPLEEKQVYPKSKEYTEATLSREELESYSTLALDESSENNSVEILHALHSKTNDNRRMTPYMENHEPRLVLQNSGKGLKTNLDDQPPLQKVEMHETKVLPKAKQEKKKTNLLLYLFGGIVVLLIALLAYSFTRPPKKIIVVQKKKVNDSVSLDTSLEKQKIEFIQLLKKIRAQIEFTNLLQGWKKSAFEQLHILSKHSLWKEKEHAELYKEIGDALAQKNEFYSSLLFFNKYLAVAELDDVAKSKMSKRIKLLKDQLQIKDASVQPKWTEFKKFLKEQRWKKAHVLYKEIIENPMLSFPLKLKYFFQLQQYFPGFVLVELKKAMDENYFETEKKLTQQHIEKAQLTYTRLQKQWKVFTDEIVSLLKHKNNRKLVRFLQKVQKESPYFYFQDKLLIKDILLPYYSKELNSLIKCFQVIGQLRSRLERKGLALWKSTYAEDTIQMTFPPMEELHAVLKNTLTLQNYFQSMVQSLQKRGVSSATSYYERTVTISKKIPQKETKDWLQLPWKNKTIFQVLEKNQELFGASRQLTSSFEVANLSSFQKYKTIFLSEWSKQLSEFPSLFTPSVAKRDRNWVLHKEKLIQTGLKTYQEAQNSFQSKNWKKAKSYYLKFKKMFPKADKPKKVSYWINKCDCSLGLSVFCD